MHHFTQRLFTRGVIFVQGTTNCEQREAIVNFILSLFPCRRPKEVLSRPPVFSKLSRPFQDADADRFKRKVNGIGQVALDRLLLATDYIVNIKKIEKRKRCKRKLLQCIACQFSRLSHTVSLLSHAVFKTTFISKIVSVSMDQTLFPRYVATKLAALVASYSLQLDNRHKVSTCSEDNEKPLKIACPIYTMQPSSGNLSAVIQSNFTRQRNAGTATLWLE